MAGSLARFDWAPGGEMTRVLVPSGAADRRGPIEGQSVEAEITMKRAPEAVTPADRESARASSQ